MEEFSIRYFNQKWNIFFLEVWAEVTLKIQGVSKKIQVLDKK